MSKNVHLVPKNVETSAEIAQSAREELERIIAFRPFVAMMFVVERHPDPDPRCEIAGTVPNSMAIRGGLARYAFAATEAGEPEPIEEGEP